MITSPWNSTALRQHKLDKILSEIAIAKAMGALINDGPRVLLVTPLAEKVDAFVLPITSVEYAERKLNDNGAVFMDGRSFMRKENRSDSGFVVNNQMQADFFNRIGELTALWIAQPIMREDFMRTGDIAAQVYISWLSSAITNKLGVDLEVAREIQIITAVFFAQQFHSAEDSVSDRGKEKFVKLIQRWTRHPIQLIQSIVESLPYMELLSDFVKALQEHFSQNTRVTQVNTGYLVMSLGRSWFGYGATEIASVALEYPPVFLALVEAAANAKVWRKTHLGKLVENLNQSRAAESFARSMEILAGEARGSNR
ncbi:hypothetical protein PA10_00110 [Pseudomonas phage pPa_SNUABM_DT01]|nr:hypothetical protein PA10_00110 [Pseudomonas phage pPa_SNUABM_DT01]